jgi:hypothetical protein
LGLQVQLLLRPQSPNDARGKIRSRCLAAETADLTISGPMPSPGINVAGIFSCFDPGAINFAFPRLKSAAAVAASLREASHPKSS